ncbi:MAG: hypothetical protein MRK02_16545 [Candidatus Scalindua sp.]|nr:hypothetical protein [Candidatus Scalindua sp.]
MELVIDVIQNLAYVYEEVFWLKEILLIVQSLVVFGLVWWFLTLKHKYTLLISLSAFLGGICTIFGDFGYWNDNDVLKYIAPSSLYFIGNKDKERKNDILLFAFLCPFFVISYEPYRSISIAALSILSHVLIYFFIFMARKRICLSTGISIFIGLLYNYIGNIASPGTNDNLVNPMLITLFMKGIDSYTKNDNYTLFLQYLWIVLLCFAYFGNWIFYSVSDYYDMFPCLW